MLLMNQICPNPLPWSRAYELMLKFAEKHSVPPPPKPLILAGWTYSNDVEKQIRWKEAVSWMTQNGCQDIVWTIAEDEFYCSSEPTTHVVGPLSEPLYRIWDCTTQPEIGSEVQRKHMDALLDAWASICGEIAATTKPVRFSGKKSRRLIVEVTAPSRPPWGEWHQLSQDTSKRRTFTKFRSAVNQVIEPHKVDHISFTNPGTTTIS